MPRTLNKLQTQTPHESLNSSPLQSARQKQPQIYRIQKNIPIIKKQSQVTVRIIKLQILVIFVAIIMYASIYGIKYLIINSKTPQQQVANCIEGTILFNGWNFNVNCTNCDNGYKLNTTMNDCLQINK